MTLDASRRTLRLRVAARFSALLLTGAALCTATAVAGTIVYAYDALGRLESVTRSNGIKITYSLDAAGNRTLVAVTDIQAPSAPGALSGVATSGTQINLSWGAATDNLGVARYRVYRGGTAVTEPTGTAFTDTGLTSGATYSYRVTALDAAGNESVSSNTIAVTTPDTVAPTVPTGLGGAAVSGSQINLSWNASTDNVAVSVYRVYRNGAHVGTPTTTSFSDINLAQTTSYSYSVAAVDAAGNASATSPTVSVATPDVSAPSSPTGLSATPVSGTQINLAWSAASDNVGVAGYRIYRGGSYLDSTTGLSYADTGVAQATTYSYSVTAFDAAGNSSGASPPAVATTPDVSAPIVPGAPGFSSIGTSTATASWSGSTDNVGVAAYDYQLNGGSWTSNGTGTSVTLTGLSPNTSYTVSVRARDAAGNVSGSSSGSFTTQPMIYTDTFTVYAGSSFMGNGMYLYGATYSMGSISPRELTGGGSIATLYEMKQYGATQFVRLEVTGSLPSDWLISVSCNGVTKNGYASNNVWQWSGPPGFFSTGTYTCSITHK